ncbi:uncharacterized protein LOC101862068 [Aplysia californica]|uniref:Uncharacterized protein LOC101862068 n=1 Tax=Aplysia californica TaxID=6500 RepID=A0ABM1W0V8_APLCA|nr:uncharacterized protein LOC101862068 [Aplysia californica]
MDMKTTEGFEKEIQSWIEEGILLPWNEKVEIGIIPLMAVVQPTKNKVRPVLDYRELNKYISSHTGGDFTDVCGETLREWRQTTDAATIVDLKGAYLQIRVSQDLWKYQLVNFKGKTYCLTRLGFGLTSAPRIMTKILKTVLNKDEKIDSATQSYIDDILLDESKVTSAALVKHLANYGLTTKEPEPLDGGAALGLKLKSDSTGDLIFSRANRIPHAVFKVTKRELFSICGKLTGHYPVAGWLRIACSYIKRRANGTNWEEIVNDEVEKMLKEMLSRLTNEDPVKGKWYVPKATKGTVWCDASSIGYGVLLEVNGNAVEDAAWLRKPSDFDHINVAELEAVMKGVNMAIKWNISEIEVITDSATVAGWIKTVLSEERRVHTKGAAELIVKRRLGILKSLINEFGLVLSVTLVPTRKNKADILTRVKKEWLSTGGYGMEEGEPEPCVCATGHLDLKDLHDMHHMGVDRTLYLARKVLPETSRADVKKVVQACEQCQSIDPAPVVHEAGNLDVATDWTRLAIDITHHHQVPYLSIVDCGPGRFAIWKKLRRETAGFVTEVVEELMLERGPVREILMDNGTVFRSDCFWQMLQKWNIKPLFRAAYRPTGNGIVERHHRTVKSIAERGNIPPQEAVFWYNSTPRAGLDPASVPQRAVYRYDWRNHIVVNEEEDGPGRFEVGDDVWVKPPQSKCTTKWNRGTVTGVNSINNVAVDGMARHVLDVRRVVRDVTSEEEDDEGGGGEQQTLQTLTRNEGAGEPPPRRYPDRVRKTPGWLVDYETQ